MSDVIAADRDRLSQAALLKQIKCDFRLPDLVTVYSHEANDEHSHSFYCALISSSKIESSLASMSWDLMHGHGLPGAVKYYDNGQEQVEYLRFGDRSRIEPLVIDREFHGIRPDYKEISEEFRLFHHLFHDRKHDRYYKIGDSGNDELVALVEPTRIQIRLKEIRQFLAIKEMHLALLFDCREDSVHSLAELGLVSGGSTQREDLLAWGLHFGDFGGIGSHRTFSRLLGKRLIRPLPKEKSGFWSFAEDVPKVCVEFIIGISEDGDEVLHTSNPECLGNNFGANPNAPNYLTPVHFRKLVLDKYYQQPGKYSVDDSMLWCGSLWNMTIDNHHDDRVIAWLGDVGRDLPYEEQLHWRSHNIPPTGGVSETFFRRQLLAQFADSDRPEHVFQQRYRELSGLCQTRLGWPLLLPLTAEDAHHLQGLRVPATDEQKDFDELVQSLTKVLIDSLNEKALNGLIPLEKQGEIKGSVSRLEVTFGERGVSGFEPHIAFLRKLQALRSSGAAHRKGSNYRKITQDFDVDSLNLRTAFAGIFEKAIANLEFLISTVGSGSMGPYVDKPST